VMNADTPAPYAGAYVPHEAGRRPDMLSRRRLLQAGGAIAAVAAGAVAPSRAFGVDQPVGAGVTVDNLGPGVVAYATLADVLVGDTLYVGSRNLDPSRVVGFHAPTHRVIETYFLGNGNFVEGLAADGTDVLYAGVTHAADRTNLYRCDLLIGEVTELVNVPDLFIRDLAVAPDGIVYIVGRPRPEHGDGPPVYSYNPATGDLTRLAVPEPDADQGYAVDVTDSTVYYGCNSILTDRTGSGLFAVDRATGGVTKLRDGNIRNHAVRVFGDVLTVGGYPPAGDDWFAVLDLGDGTWREFDVPGKAVARRGDELVFIGEDGELRLIHLATGTMTLVGTFGFFALGKPGLVDSQVVASRTGFVSTFDLETGQLEQHDLIGAGAPGDPQLGMSVGAGDGFAYVGGTGTVAVHDLSSRTVTHLSVPGEIKDMVVVDGVAYLGLYNGRGIWEHRPGTGEPPRQVAEFPSGHNRPRAVTWDDVNRFVAVGMQNDSGGTGSLLLFDPATQSLTAHIEPLGPRAVNAVAAGHGLVYIGGNENGDLAAWDPVAGREVWRLANPFGQSVGSLVVRGQRLFGTTTMTRFFVIDLADGPELIHQANIEAVTSVNPRLWIDRGLIYGASARSMFRIDPITFEPQLLVDDINGEWFSGPRLAVDNEHWLYTLAGRDLVRVRDRSGRAFSMSG
jgi:hypothetical protein